MKESPLVVSVFIKTHLSGSCSRSNCLFFFSACMQQLLGLDMREQPKSSAFSALAAGYKKHVFTCFSSSGTESRSATSHNWAQHKETTLPSRWNKIGFWSERAISMVEGDTGGLGWASPEPCLEKATPSTLSLPSSTASLSAAACTSSRYKTELCRTFTERGVCKYGSKCQFAHGPEELRGISRHPKYKTEPCRTFHSIGFCPYGIRCHFVHNNEDDNVHARPPASVLGAQRPPPLKQSFSCPGFPSTFRPLEPPLAQSSFLRVPSASLASPPASTAISDLLNLAFPELSPSSSIDQAWESMPQFLPSPDSGCSHGELTPTLSPSQMAPSQPEGCPRQSLTSGVSLGSRSLSLTSLSDHEGGCSSSASSLSGSESSSAFEGAGKRLPIFSQLSVPDEGFCSEGSGSSASFFL